MFFFYFSGLVTNRFVAPAFWCDLNAAAFVWRILCCSALIAHPAPLLLAPHTNTHIHTYKKFIELDFSFGFSFVSFCCGSFVSLDCLGSSRTCLALTCAPTITPGLVACQVLYAACHAHTHEHTHTHAHTTLHSLQNRMLLLGWHVADSSKHFVCLSLSPSSSLLLSVCVCVYFCNYYKSTFWFMHVTKLQPRPRQQLWNSTIWLNLRAKNTSNYKVCAGLACPTRSPNKCGQCRHTEIRCNKKKSIMHHFSQQNVWQTDRQAGRLAASRCIDLIQDCVISIWRN